MYEILSDPHFELASRHRRFGAKTANLLMGLAQEQEVYESITGEDPWRTVESWTGAVVGSLLQDIELAGKYVTPEAQARVEEWHPLEQPVDVKVFLTSAGQLGKAVRGAGNPPRSPHNLCIACENIGLALLPPPIALHICMGHDGSAVGGYLSLLDRLGMLSIVLESGRTVLRYERFPSFMEIEDNWPLLVGLPLYPVTP